MSATPSAKLTNYHRKMTLRERFDDTHRRGEEALIRLGLADTAKRLEQ